MPASQLSLMISSKSYHVVRCNMSMLRRQHRILTVATATTGLVGRGNSSTTISSRCLRYHRALACGAGVSISSPSCRIIVGLPSSALVQHRRYPPSTPTAATTTAATTTTLFKRSLHLAPREVDHLLLHQVGQLAQYRLARGLKLNVPEARALIAMQMM